MQSARIRKLIYLINALVVICVVFAVLFLANSIRINYKRSSNINYEIEKEYNEILNKYKKTMIFVLKNNLPQTIEYFNAISSALYNLSPAERIKVILPKEVDEVRRDSEMPSDDLLNIVECYEGRCIKAFLVKKNILSEILDTIPWFYGEIKTVPVRKDTLFKISIKKTWSSNKIFIVVVLFSFFMFYLYQTVLFLFINFKQTKAYNDLLTKSDENNLDLIDKTEALDKLYKDSPYIYGIVDRYFTYYAHQLVSREVHIEEVNIPDLLNKTGKFFSYQVVKQKLNIVFSSASTINFINTDSEILFVILLNLIFKSISRSKISSEITVRVFREQDVINIEIVDIGYEYNEKASDEIKIYMLPELMLENLCRKVGIVSIEEEKNGEVNVISIQIASSGAEENHETDEVNNDAMKIEFGLL